MGVVLGVGVLIVVISVMSGFDRQLRDTLLGFEPHIVVRDSHGGVLTDYESVMEKVKDHPGVLGAAPIVMGPVMMEIFRKDGTSDISMPFVRGIHPDYEPTVSSIVDDIIIGEEMDFPGRVVYIGRDLAREVQLGLGDSISLHSYGNLKKMTDALDSGEKLAIFPEEFEIDGIFDVGYYEFNANIILLSLWDAQDLYGLGSDNLVHGVQLMVADPMRAGELRDELTEIMGPDFMLETWLERKGDLLNAIMVEKNVMFYILFFIMLVAAFGIMGTLIAFVIQKTREIGILKASRIAFRQEGKVLESPRKIEEGFVTLHPGVGGFEEGEIDFRTHDLPGERNVPELDDVIERREVETGNIAGDVVAPRRPEQGLKLLRRRRT